MGLACIGGSVALLSILFKYQHVFIKHLQRFFPNQSALPIICNAFNVTSTKHYWRIGIALYYF